MSCQLHVNLYYWANKAEKHTPSEPAPQTCINLGDSFAWLENFKEKHAVLFYFSRPSLSLAVQLSSFEYLYCKVVSEHYASSR